MSLHVLMVLLFVITGLVLYQGLRWDAEARKRGGR